MTDNVPPAYSKEPPTFADLEKFTGDSGQSGTEKEAKLRRDGLLFQQLLQVVVAAHDTSSPYTISAEHMRELNNVYPDEARIVNIKLLLKNEGRTPTVLSKVMFGDLNILPAGNVIHCYSDGKRASGSHCLTVGDVIELEIPIKWSKDDLGQLTRRGKDPWARVCTHLPVARMDAANPPVVYLSVVKVCNGEPHMVRLAFQALKAGIKPKRDKNGGPFLYPIDAKSWEQCIDDIGSQVEIENRGLTIVFDGEPGTVRINLALAYNTNAPEWRKPGIMETVVKEMTDPVEKKMFFAPPATISTDNDSVEYLSASDLWTKSKIYKRFMRKTDPLCWMSAMSNETGDDIYTKLCAKTAESPSHDAMTSFMANAIRFYTRMADSFEPSSRDEHLSLRNIDETGYSKVLRSGDDTTIAKCMSLLEAMMSVAINSKKEDFSHLKNYDGEENPMPYLSHWIDSCPVLHDAVLARYAVKRR